MDIDGFYPDILPSIPGYILSAVERAVENVLVDFCRRSTIWRESTTLVISAGETIVDITSETEGVQIVRLQSAKLNDIPFFTFRQLVPGTIILDSAFSDDTSLDIEISLQPERPVTTVPDWIYDDWKEGIVSGTKARLMMVPKKEWTDPGLGQVHGREYQSAINAARIEAERKNQLADICIQPVRFV